MKKTSFIRAWMQKAFLLLAAMAAYGVMQAQPDYWTIFGLSGSGCNTYNRMTCVVPSSPSSFSGEMTTLSTSYYDMSAGYTVPTLKYSVSYQNSMYDEAGHLLFVVNADGIWAPDGSGIYGFNGSSSSGSLNYMPPGCSGGFDSVSYFDVAQALSEICIVPNYGQCSNSYYVLFWSGGLENGALLRAVEVDIDPAGFSAGNYSTCYTCTNNILNSPDCSLTTGGAGSYNTIAYDEGDPYGTFEIAVNPNPDHSIDIYTINNVASSGTLRKWTISATGALPAVSSSAIGATVVSSGALLPAASTKAKIFRIPHGTNTDLVFAYVASADGYFGGRLQTYNITTGDIEAYVAPYDSSEYGWQNIWGFEYITTDSGAVTHKPTFIFTYQDEYLMHLDSALTYHGGFGYAYPGYSGGATPITLLSSQPDYCFSDLELDQHGDLFAVNEFASAFNPLLAYIPQAALSSIVSSFTAPALCASCSNGENISVYNGQFEGFNGYVGNYLGSQIRNENYNIIPQYNIYNDTVTSTQTWTPTSNPVATPLGGVSVPTITVQNNITVMPGATLSINNMTVEFGPGAVITILPPVDSDESGGTLILEHDTLTASGVCNAYHPSWAGIRIVGDTAFPEVNGPVHCQGQVTMENSTISYADIAVQNGTGYSNSGGIILATSCLFYNNAVSLSLLPYAHTGALAEINNNNFLIDSSLWFVPPSAPVQITGIHVTSFGTNTLTNATNGPVPEAIFCADAGIAIDHATISNFIYGIWCTTIAAAKTITVGGCTFNNNQFGIYSTGLIAQNIVGNTFNIPAYTGPAGSYYPGTPVLMMPDQNVGALMNASTGYNISNNIFQTNATTASGYYNYTTGTLEYNTGGDNNEVTNNTFTGVGTAMLSNFLNNNTTTSPESGLVYSCNTDSLVNFDISILGFAAASGGIAYIQGTSTSGSIYFDAPTGNYFAHSSTYNVYDQQVPIWYYFQGAFSMSNPQYPALRTSGVTPAGNTNAAACFEIPGNGGPFTVSSVSGLISAAMGSTLAYRVATANVNYYMNDTNGVQHRDSLYYWAGQMGTAYGDLLTATMLIEDSLIDSANTVYNNITQKYSLDSIEANDFTQGRSLMDVIIAKREGDRNILSLTDVQITTLRSVKASTTMWAHARAEGWLYLVNGEPFTDTLLYPDAIDSTDTTGDGGRLSNPNNNPVKPFANQSQLNNSVHPNPVHDFLQVMYTAKTTDDITIQIEDISGRTVITQSLQSGVQTPVDMSALVPGMYLYRIFEGVNVTMIGKIAKD